ncbi:Hypothetical protein PHPALM_9028 [Phytophthora palmivora]|uniref:Uncharacterized protein n=1 Tax=Phytophthora palmivora TaxID=4796 RepID=A0A2P4Y8D1_9STRA|nr:Hypothetical protein PHPALM_9028 [Phytophthora palmivora]
MPLDGLIPIGGASGGNSGSKRGGSSDLTGGLISLSGTRDNVDVDMSDFDVIMPLDGLIPIGGASGGNSGSKRGGSSDLTGGLISLSGTRDNVDVDMSDFDVGDLLGDDSSKTKSKTSSKTTSDDKKKKKSKEKGKSKKSKSKTKKSAFDDDDDYGNDDGNDWTSSAKNWDSAAELEMAAAAARRKNGGGGLDGEFAKMLGLDSGDIGGGGDFGSVESPLLSPEPIVNRDDKQD